MYWEKNCLICREQALEADGLCFVSYKDTTGASCGNHAHRDCATRAGLEVPAPAKKRQVPYVVVTATEYERLGRLSWETPGGFSPPVKTFTFEDIFFGNTARPIFRMQLWEIAERSARETEVIKGIPSDIILRKFLDGAVERRVGRKGITIPVQIYGKETTAFCLYELGHDARVLMNAPELPDHVELRRRVDLDKSSPNQ